MKSRREEVIENIQKDNMKKREFRKRIDEIKEELKGLDYFSEEAQALKTEKRNLELDIRMYNRFSYAQLHLSGMYELEKMIEFY